ncbi:PLP-dependent transferase [Enterobacteriaceae endosymbiont of Donacia semicuprea]|uniref:PLP-dependent transferase n=1 Tax=Enterobacteriaceae endosymbiont of Donacia semicuprea TaxID=2675783 RepID=UPI0014493255|nr:hypothetical protein GJT91_00085 [Enterobacteriaceae endosymbiont of Donacia semicuprea]
MKKINVISIINDILLTLLLQNLLDLESDLVIHFCTKYLNGHSDIILGAIYYFKKYKYHK